MSGATLERRRQAARPEADEGEQRLEAMVASRLFGTAHAPPARIGRFALLARIDRGGMGDVYAAHDPLLDRKVALKLLHPLQDTGTLGRARLLREAQTLARVSHPNVVQVYEVGEHEDEIFVTMELVRGTTLRTWHGEKPRSWREVFVVYLQAARGLVAAHAAGVVHRDFKPDNVMIGEDGRVRVMDFGLARVMDGAETEVSSQSPGSVSTSHPPTLTAADMIVGTPAYMAPEQYDRSEVNAFTDQFAFCVALFEGLYGKRPFVGDNMRSLAANVRRGEIREVARRGVPRWLRGLVFRGLCVDPAGRWPSMAALLTRMERGQQLARLRVAGALCLCLVVVEAGAWGWRQADLARREAACVAAGASIDEVWNDAARGHPGFIRGDRGQRRGRDGRAGHAVARPPGGGLELGADGHVHGERSRRGSGCGGPGARRRRQEGIFYFFDEPPLSADFRQRNIENLVTGCLDAFQGDGKTGRQLLQTRLNPLTLMHGQLAATRPENKRRATHRESRPDR